VYYSPFDVFFDEQNILQPDIVYISKEKSELLKDDGIHGAPDLIIEILSPSSGYYDTKIKKNLYEFHGVKEYWIVDPNDKEVIGYELVDKIYKEIYRGIGKFTIKLLGLSVEL
jgi:Uma2 family endonuclease